MVKERPFFVVKYLIAAILALVSLYLAYDYLASDYPTFLRGVLVRVKRPSRLDHYLGNSRLLPAYKLGKYLVSFLLWFLSISLYNAVVRRQGWLSAWLDRITAAIYAVFSRNRVFWRQLDPFAKKGLFFILAIQFVAFLFLLLSLPYHYDEAWSYAHFAGVGFVQTAAYYPYPNNHIFYNLVSRLFSFLPFEAEITTRLPSFFASFISTWYFFKLAHKYFKTPLALLVTVLFLAAYPVILYSVEGRGYGFTVCCAVLLFYAADHFTDADDPRKYRLLYLAAMVAGLYTIPSFLFTILGTSGIVVCYHLLRKQWRALFLFILDNAIAGVAAVVLYMPIIFFNGYAALANPSGSQPLPLHSLLPLILPHLSTTLHYLAGSPDISLSWIVIPIALTLLSGRKQSLLPWLTAGILLSPPALLVLFPIIPFERTWVYLAAPLALSIGFMLTLLIGLGKKLPVFAGGWQAGAAWRHPAIIGLYTVLFVLLFANFRKLHRRDYNIDYDIRAHFEKLGPSDIDHIHTIGFTGPSLQFYVAEDLYFKCFSRNPKRQVTFGKRDSFHGFDDDVLIVAPDSVKSFKLDNYECIGNSYENVYSLYIRKY